jgi:sulfate permease, SulP family
MICRRQWLARDLLAGLSVSIVMIPSVIAYARLMGLPPQHGLYAALVPLLVYPWVGSSRQVIVGPDIAISLLMASAIAPLAGGDAARAARLAAALALLSGLFLVLGARAKIGAVADFLSQPVLVGYMTGAALILAASQLGSLFGLTLVNQDFFPRLGEAIRRLPEIHWPTLRLGLLLLVLLIGLRRFVPECPVALAVCATALGCSWVWDLERQGVALVGAFPSGLPALAFPLADWRDVHALLPAAVGIALLTYTEGILLARAFAAKNGYEIRPNQELDALGVADLCTGLFQGFAVTGSQARTSINDASGGKTQVAGLCAAAALILFLFFLTPVVARLPVVALAVVLMYGGFTLVEFRTMGRIYRCYPGSAAVAALTTLAVLAAGVVPGILVGVVLSLLGLIKRISHPPDAVLCEVPGHGFHDLGPASSHSTIPGLVAYRFYAPLLFSNCGYFSERVHQLIAESPTRVHWFLLDAQAITDVDVTAAEMLHALHQDLRRQGIALKIVHANRPFREVLERTGLIREIHQTNFYPSVHECVAAFHAAYP